MVTAEEVVDWPFHDPGPGPDGSDPTRPLVLFPIDRIRGVAELARRMQAHIDERSLHGVEVPRAVVYSPSGDGASWFVTQPGGLVLERYSSVGEAVARAWATVPVRVDLVQEIRNALRRGPHRGDLLAEVVAAAAELDVPGYEWAELVAPVAHQAGQVRIPVGPDQTQLEQLEAVRHWLQGPVARVASDGEPAVTLRLPDGVSIPVVRLEQQGINPEIHVAVLPRDRGLWVNHYATGLAAVRLDHGVTLDELYRRLDAATMDTIFFESGGLNDVEVEHGSVRHAPWSLLRSASGGEWMTAEEFRQLLPAGISSLVLLRPLGVGVRWEQSRFITQAFGLDFGVIAAESFTIPGLDGHMLEWHQTWVPRDFAPLNDELIDLIAERREGQTWVTRVPCTATNDEPVDRIAERREGPTWIPRDFAPLNDELIDLIAEPIEGRIDLDFVLREAPSVDVIRRWLRGGVGLAVAVPPDGAVAENVHRVTLSVPARFVWTHSSGRETFSVLDTRALVAGRAVVNWVERQAAA
ncbi:hypothetical protein, partial [Dactylosporangium darangshiense]|uniref:hypothetical protein n=1 Tax=Dactylosporangium darangshiense TaxID=579108 RepID=UPI00363D845A